MRAARAGREVLSGANGSVVAAVAVAVATEVVAAVAAVAVVVVVAVAVAVVVVVVAMPLAPTRAMYSRASADTDAYAEYLWELAFTSLDDGWWRHCPESETVLPVSPVPMAVSFLQSKHWQFPCACCAQDEAHSSSDADPLQKKLFDGPQ